MQQQLSPNSLAFVALTNEYCQLMENALSYERASFVEALLKLLPRIYISALDLQEQLDYYDTDFSPALDEPTYDAVRARIAALMADEDVYLEVFHEDMKYSDTPIATSVSENLADLYQEFFNLIASLRDLDTESQNALLAGAKQNFAEYWGQTLCNVLRALHSIHTTAARYDDDIFM